MAPVDPTTHRWEPHPEAAMVTSNGVTWCPSCSVLVELGFDGPLSTWDLARRLGLRRPVMRRVLGWMEARGEVTRFGSVVLPGPDRYADGSSVHVVVTTWGLR